MSNRDKLGDSCKALEMADNGRKAMKGLPLLARLDGRAFHTFCRGLTKPWDESFADCMQLTAAYLVEKFHARVGYTQSDEISLLWYEDYDSAADLPFGGRFHKLTSILAGTASVKLAKLVQELLPQKSHLVPCFDARVWQVPTKQAALDVFIWREDDAVRNSLSSLAQAHFSHKELQSKHSAHMHEMLHAKGINWAHLPDRQKRGTYLRRVTEQRPLTPAELERIPEAHRPEGQLVMRSIVRDIQLPPIRKLRNSVDVLFEGAAPELRTVPHPLDVETRLMELAKLQEGWLDGQGSALAPGTIAWASAVLKDAALLGLSQPYLYPTLEGTIQAEWSLGTGIEVTSELDGTSLEVVLGCLDTKTGKDESTKIYLGPEAGPWFRGGVEYIVSFVTKVALGIGPA